VSGTPRSSTFGDEGSGKASSAVDGGSDRVCSGEGDAGTFPCGAPSKLDLFGAGEVCHGDAPSG